LRSSGGTSGIAPFCVQTNAETFTAMRCVGRDKHSGPVRTPETPAEHQLRDQGRSEGIARPYGVCDLYRHRRENRLLIVEPDAALPRALGVNEAEYAHLPEESVELIRIIAPEPFHAAEHRQLVLVALQNISAPEGVLDHLPAVVIAPEVDVKDPERSLWHCVKKRHDGPTRDLAPLRERPEADEIKTPHHLHCALSERDMVVGGVLRKRVGRDSLSMDIDLHEAGLMFIRQEKSREEPEGKLLTRLLTQLIVPHGADDCGLKAVLRAVEGKVRGSPAEARPGGVNVKEHLAEPRGADCPSGES